MAVPICASGQIDRSGEYCEWDGLRLPLGAIIAPPQPGRANPEAAPAASVAPNATAGPTRRHLLHAHHRVSAMGSRSASTRHGCTAWGQCSEYASSRQRNQRCPQVSAGVAAQVPPRAEHAGEHYDPQTASVTGSPLASGFVDRGKKTAEHVRQIARVVHDHGIGAVVPSREDIKTWASDFKHQCLDHMQDCLEKKAHEAADELNEFRKNPRRQAVRRRRLGLRRDRQRRCISRGARAGAVFGGVVRTGEKAVAKAVGKKVLREAEESIIEHADEAAARRLLHQAQERAKKEAERRAAKEAAEQGGEDAAQAAQRIKSKGSTRRNMHRLLSKSMVAQILKRTLRNNGASGKQRKQNASTAKTPAASCMMTKRRAKETAADEKYSKAGRS